MSEPTKSILNQTDTHIRRVYKLANCGGELVNYGKVVNRLLLKSIFVAFGFLARCSSGAAVSDSIDKSHSDPSRVWSCLRSDEDMIRFN